MCLNAWIYIFNVIKEFVSPIYMLDLSVTLKTVLALLFCINLIQIFKKLLWSFLWFYSNNTGWSMKYRIFLAQPDYDSLHLILVPWDVLKIAILIQDQFTRFLLSINLVLVTDIMVVSSQIWGSSSWFRLFNLVLLYSDNHNLIRLE